MATDLHARVIITAVNRVSGVMGGIAKSLGGVGKRMAATGAAMRSTGLEMTAALTLPAVGIVREFTKLDSAMGDLDKVFVGTNAQFAQTQKIIGEMARRELPLSHVEITKLFTAANQAGIAFKEQRQWVQLAGEFMVAFDTTADKAAKTLAQMKQTLGLTTPELRDLAGAMNIVANNSAAAEADILGVYERVVPLVKFIGGQKAARDLSVLGGAMVGGMIDPEKAGTGLRNIITRVVKPTKEVEKAFGLVNAKVQGFNMNAAQMASMMKTDMSGAFVKLFDALSKMEKTDALRAISGIAGLRGQDVAGPFLTNLPKVVDLLKQVQDEEKRSASVHAEFAKRMKRLEPNFILLKNSLMDVAFAIGRVWQPYIERAAKSLATFASGLDQNDPKFQTAAKTFGALALAGPGLIVLGTALKGMGGAIQMLAKPGQLLALGGLAGVVFSVAKNWEAVAPSFERLKESFGALSQSLAALSGSKDPTAAMKSWDLTVAETAARAIDGLAKAMDALRAVVENPLDFSSWEKLWKIGEGYKNPAQEFGEYLGKKASKWGLNPFASTWQNAYRFGYSMYDWHFGPQDVSGTPGKVSGDGGPSVPSVPRSGIARAAKSMQERGGIPEIPPPIIQAQPPVMPPPIIQASPPVMPPPIMQAPAPGVPRSGIARAAQSMQGPKVPLVRDLAEGGKIDVTGKVEAEVTKPIDVTGKVDANLKGHARVEVIVKATEGSQVMGMSAASSGHVRANVGATGASMADTGSTP